jgi:NAD(P)-dependent dehydrogenase (short-subunit alcohol dehydrogenase family)
MLFAEQGVIVTGAGRNVGRAIARRFVDEGARVVCVDIDDGRGQATVDELNRLRNESAFFVRCDVSSRAEVEQMTEAAVALLDEVNVLVNCVAITDRGVTILDLDEDVWRRVFAVSVDSVFLCSKYVGRRMVAQGKGGAIVNIGSTSAYRGRVNATAYSAAKSAVLNLSRSIASQLGAYGIRVNTVTPNKVGSPVGEDCEPADRKRQNLLGRGAVPEDIANAVAFIASDQAGFVTASDLLVDGGALYGDAPMPS